MYLFGCNCSIYIYQLVYYLNFLKFCPTFCRIVHIRQYIIPKWYIILLAANFKIKMSENEWELSKENIQPLRQGRNSTNLNVSLSRSHEPDLEARLRRERRYCPTSLYL